MGAAHTQAFYAQRDSLQSTETEVIEIQGFQVLLVFSECVPKPEGFLSLRQICGRKKQIFLSSLALPLSFPIPHCPRSTNLG